MTTASLLGVRSGWRASPGKTHHHDVRENPGANRAAVARVDPATNCVDAVAFVGTTDAEGRCTDHRASVISYGPCERGWPAGLNRSAR